LREQRDRRACPKSVAWGEREEIHDTSCPGMDRKTMINGHNLPNSVKL